TVYAIWPFRMSVIAGTVPLYGTWRALSCAIELKSSVKRCAVAPVPEDENVYLSGFARTSATNSFAFAAGKDGFTTSANGVLPIRLIGARSLSGSYGVFCSTGMIEIGPLEAASSVLPSGAAFATASEPL